MSASPESLSRMRLKAAATALRAYPGSDLLADCKTGEPSDDDVLAGRRRELVAQLLDGLALELRIVHLLLEHHHRLQPGIELAQDDALAHVLGLVGRFLLIDSGLRVAHILGHVLAADIPQAGRGRDLHRHVAREGDEVLVLGHEVGVAVDLHENPDLGAGVDVGLHRPLGCRALAEVLDLLSLLYAQDLDRLLDVAAGLGERLLAVHHSGSGALAQGLHVLGSDHHLAHDSPPSASPSAPPSPCSDAGSAAAACSAGGSADGASATSGAASGLAGGSGAGAAASGLAGGSGSGAAGST